MAETLAGVVSSVVASVFVLDVEPPPHAASPKHIERINRFEITFDFTIGCIIGCIAVEMKLDDDTKRSRQAGDRRKVKLTDGKAQSFAELKLTQQASKFFRCCRRLMLQAVAA